MPQRKKLTVQPEIPAHQEIGFGKAKNIETPLLSEQEALCASEDKFRFMFEHSINGKSFTLPSGEIIVNKAFCDMLGYSREKLQNKRWQDISYPEDIELTQRALDKILSGEQDSVRFAKRYLHRNGTVVWADVSTVLLRGQSGEPLYFMTEVNDTTTRKQAGDALKKSEEKFKLSEEKFAKAFWTSPYITVITRTKDGYLLEVNEAFETILGYTRAEAIGHSSIELGLWENLADRERLMPILITNGRLKKEEVQFRTKSGQVLDCLYSGEIIELDREKYSLSIIEDITERNRAEKEREESENRYRSLFEHASIGIFHSLPEGRFLRVNSTLARMLGYDSPAEMISLITDIGSQIYVDSQRRTQIVTNTLDQDDWVYAENRFRRKDGSFMMANMTARKVLNLDGTLAYLEGFVEDITERRQAEDALRNSELRYKQLFDAIPESVLLIGIDRCVVAANQASARLYGYESPQQLEGLDTRLLIAEKDRERATQIQADVLKGEERRERHYIEVRCDGSEFAAEVISTTLRGPQQEVLGYIGITRDITERKRAEEALQASEQSTHQIAEQLQIVNQIGLKIAAGLDFDQLMEKIYEQCHLIGDVDTFYIALYDDATGKITFPFNYKNKERRELPSRNIKEYPGLVGYVIEHHQTFHIGKGANIPANIKVYHQTGISSQSYICVPLIINDRVTGVLSMQSIKTDAYTAEQVQTLELVAIQVAIAIQNSKLYAQVEDERNLANALIDNMPGAMCLIDLQGRPVRWNKYAETITGYSPDEVRNLDFLSLFPAVEKAHLAELFTRAFAGEQVATDAQIIAKGGAKTIPIFATGARVWLENDENLLVIGIDISERKQAEQKLKEYFEHLEEMVEERTRELRAAQDQLLRQEKLAVLGQIAGSVSHELRNPLGVINNSIYYLKLVQPEAEEKIKKHHAMIEQEVRNAVHIISDLLDYVRNIAAEREQVAVGELVRQTLERFPIPPAVAVEINLPEGLPDVFADPRQVVQVLGNLTTNAWQAMPEGGKLYLSGTLSVSSDQLSVKDEQWVQIHVKDSGTGITPENMEKLFEPLFSTKMSGIGLGLPVSRKLAEANGCRITVESEVGKGSAFTLVLPVYIEVK
jgi:PAS domain S-box-containing protein